MHLHSGSDQLFLSESRSQSASNLPSVPHPPAVHDSGKVSDTSCSSSPGVRPTTTPRRVVDDRSFGDRTTCSTRRKGDRGSLWRALRLAKTCKGLTGYFSARTVLGANAPELEKKELLQAGTSLGSDHSVQILPFRQPPAAVQPPASSLGGTKVKPNARPSLMPCTIRKEYVNVE